jgi:hypothetical protein
MQSVLVARNDKLALPGQADIQYYSPWPSMEQLVERERERQSVRSDCVRVRASFSPSA